ncbi:MAG: 6-phosphogluconolactonase [Thermoflexales bacterium]|nr:6-phosphogluconolactonase [Thermoflexales bacterium]
MQELAFLRSLNIYPDAEQLAGAAAERFAALAQEAIAQRGRFCVALAGGSTPRATYERLAGLHLPWAQVQVFWSDERCVPPNHAGSNYRMARLALLDRVAIPAGNVHRVQGELRPEQAANAYEAELQETLGADGRLDLVLLGMGDDGHTASLFPGTQAVEVYDRLATAVYVERLDSWRVTLTLPVLNAARHVLFLVSGAAKASALARVRRGEPLPAGLVRPVDGELAWLVDQAAGGAL